MEAYSANIVKQQKIGLLHVVVSVALNGSLHVIYFQMVSFVN